jgi:hypothetical protein
MERHDAERPTGSGNDMSLRQVAAELARRMVGLFLPGSNGLRPFQGSDGRHDPKWTDLILFHEFFR